jgi:hypothetical protein
LAIEYGFITSLVSFNLRIEAENYKMEELNVITESNENRKARFMF